MIFGDQLALVFGHADLLKPILNLLIVLIEAGMVQAQFSPLGCDHFPHVTVGHPLAHLGGERVIVDEFNQGAHSFESLFELGSHGVLAGVWRSVIRRGVER